MRFCQREPVQLDLFQLLLRMLPVSGKAKLCDICGECRARVRTIGRLAVQLIEDGVFAVIFRVFQGDAGHAQAGFIAEHIVFFAVIGVAGKMLRDTAGVESGRIKAEERGVFLCAQLRLVYGQRIANLIAVGRDDLNAVDGGNFCCLRLRRGGGLGVNRRKRNLPGVNTMHIIGPFGFAGGYIHFQRIFSAFSYGDAAGQDEGKLNGAVILRDHVVA